MNSGFPDLRRFFAPRRVALVGATEDLSKFGGRCMRQLIDFGYQGEIFPINPKRDSIFGLKCYPSVEDLPEIPDHVGIVLPASAVAAAVASCAQAKVPFATVFSAGFNENGTEAGRRLQSEIVGIARQGRLRLMGPNCNGFINFVDRFALTSTATIQGPPRAAGDIGVASQSGGAGQVNVMWRMQEAGLGVSYQCSSGNDADLDLLDYIAFMIDDPHTRVVVAIAERFSNGDKLRALALRAHAADKPIVMVKAGRTEAGSRAAASHTGAITGADDVADAALRQFGIVRVDDASELYEAAMLLRRGRRARGRRAAATSISGGNLVLLADLGAQLGIEWPPYAEATRQKLDEQLPGLGSPSNPTDLTAAAIGRPGTFAAVTATIADDPGIDLTIPVLTFATAAEIRSVAAISNASEKPVAILWTGRSLDDPALTPATLIAEGHAVFRDALPCLKAIRATMRYGEFRARLERPTPVRPSGIDEPAARALLSGIAGTLSETQSKALLACYGLPLPREHLAKDSETAMRLAREIGGPVAMKIQSADLPHKTESGAIRLNIQGDGAVAASFAEIVAAARRYAPTARIDGVLVQEMVSEGQEILLGIADDPTFGPVLTVGLGGIHVEVFKDLAFRLPPVSLEEATEMLHELRSLPLLQGVRGQPRLDIAALADAIARMSWLAFDLRDRIAEFDINPVKVLPERRGVRILDALAVIRGETPPAGDANHAD